MTYHLILCPDRYNTTSDRSNDWPNWMPLHKTQCYETAAILCLYRPDKHVNAVGPTDMDKSTRPLTPVSQTKISIDPNRS